MAYEISSSLAAGTNSFQAVTGTVSSRVGGGQFSPDGSRLASVSLRHGGAGSQDPGIDIFTSSSANGWERTESIDAGSDFPEYIRWYNDEEIFAIAGSKFLAFQSASDGWSTVTKIGNFGSYNAFYPNPDKSLIAFSSPQYPDVDIFISGASAYSFGYRINDPFGSNVDTYAVAWLNNTDIAIASPVFSTNKGRIEVWRTSDGGDNFSEIEQLDGATNDYLGASLYYQTSSGNLIVGTGYEDTAQSGQSSENGKLFLYQSSSDTGYLPDYVLTRTQITTASIRAPYNPYLAPDPSDDGRFVLMTRGTTSGTQGIGSLLAIESGSSGWKYKAIDQNVFIRPPASSTSTQIDISVSGAIVANNHLDPQGGDDVFLVHYAGVGVASSLNSSVSETIGSGGGTVKAGGTESTPRASVTIPVSALSTNTTIGVDTSDSSLPKDLGFGTEGDESLSPLVRLTPHGTTFSSAVTVTFNLIGSGDGTCPANLQLWKRSGPNSNWYPVPTNLYSCTDGVVTLSTTSFSDYIVIGGQKVARTKLNNVQLARLENVNKVLPEAINISGSSNDDIASVSASDLFILSSGGNTVPVSASTMATFFAGQGTDVSASSGDEAYRIVFVDPLDNSSIGLAVDASTLTFNPTSNTLALAGTASFNSASFADAVGIAGTLQVGGQTDLKGAVNLGDDSHDVITSTGKLSASAGLAITAGDSFTVAAAVPSTISGQLTASNGITVSGGGAFVTGELSGSAALNIKGDATIAQTMTINAADKSSASDNALLVEGTSQVKLTASESFRVTTNSNADILRARENGDIEFGGGSNTGIFLYDASTNDIKLKNPSNTGETAILLNDGFNGGIISGSSNLLIGGFGRFAGNVLPDLDNTSDLGSSALQWKDLYVNGAAHIDALGQDLDGGGFNVSGINALTASTLKVTDDLLVEGDLVVEGSTVTVDATNVTIEDTILILGSSSGGSSPAVGDRGFIFQIGSDGPRQAFIWDQSATEFALVETPTTGSELTVDVSSYADLAVGALSASGQGDFENLRVGGGTSTISNAGAAVFAGTVTANSFSGDGSGLSGVGAQVKEATSADTVKMQITFTTGSATAGGFFMHSGSLSYKPSTNTLFVSHIEPTGSGEDIIIGASSTGDGGGMYAQLDKSEARLKIHNASGGTLAGLALEYSGFSYGQVALANYESGNADLLVGVTGAGNGGSVILSGSTVIASGSFLPARDDSYDLGSTSAAWKDLHLEGDIKLTDAGTIQTAAGALTISGNAGVAVTSAATFSGKLSGSNGIDITGHADFNSSVTVDGTLTANGNVTLGDNSHDVITSTGKLSASAGLAVTAGDSFTVAAAVPATFSGKLTGSNGIDITGHADFNSSVTVDGTLTAAGDVTLGDSGADTITTNGLVQMTAETQITTNAFKLTNLDQTGSVRVTDKLLVVDEDNSGKVQELAFSNLVSDGIQTSTGQLKVVTKELVATRYQTGSILSDDFVTASLTSGDDPVDGSLQVYLNGMLLIGSSSAAQYSVSSSASGVALVFDYEYVGSAGSRRVEFRDPIDEDDVVQVRYIKK